MADLPAGFMLQSDMEAQQQPVQPTQEPQATAPAPPLSFAPLPEGFITQAEMSQAQPQKPKRDYVTRMSSITDKRTAEVSRIFEDMDAGNTNPWSGVLQVVGKGGFGTAADYLGETVGSVVSAVTPDMIEDPIKGYVGDLLGKAMDSDVAKAISAEWKQLDPDTQKNLEATGNILTFLAPKVKLGKLGVSTEKVGQAMKRERLYKTLALPDTASNRVAEAKRAFAEPTGFTAMVDEVSKIKGVSPNKSPKQNILALSDELDATDKKLFKDLRQYTDVDPNLVDSKLDLHLKQLTDEHTWLQTDPAIASAFDTNLKRMHEIVDKYPNTPAGFLRARREYDKIISKKAKDIRAPDSELKAQEAVSRVLRRALNDVVIETAPRAQVGETLAKMSNIYKAKDNLSASYANYSPITEATKDWITRHPALSYSALGATGVGAVMTSPAAVGAGAVTALGYGAYKGAPSAFSGAGALLKNVGKAQPSGAPLLRTGALYGAPQEPQQ